MAEHDKVLMRQWHPVAYAHEIGEKPVSRVLMGERLVLFRTASGIHAWKDLCVHRGAALSLGCVKDDALVCPYHGWRYDGTGSCVLIPQQPQEQAITKQARAIVYECREEKKIVWVRLGTDMQSANLPSFPEWDDPAYKTVYCGPYPLQASAPRVIENFLDVGHLAFLHEGHLGDSAYPEIADYRVDISETGIRSSEIDIYQPDPDSTGKSGIARYVYEVLGPTAARLSKTDPLTGHVFSILFAVSPIAQTESVVFVALARNYAFELPDEQFADFQTFILQQDQAVLESQRPELLPLDLQAELHLKADRLSIAYRKWLRARGVVWGTA
ncbi:Rieske 2Fe-2S domain-containing protein [Cohnella sp. GCM10012308]|uniref:aromatic ring-hydroxylating dioxygenase subunit alpha n=1 Tax=Cohnella sp. GCM10012308 TaxID=3317329 RepID=UPI003619D828